MTAARAPSSPTLSATRRAASSRACRPTESCSPRPRVRPRAPLDCYPHARLVLACWRPALGSLAWAASSLSMWCADQRSRPAQCSTPPPALFPPCANALARTQHLVWRAGERCQVLDLTRPSRVPSPPCANALARRQHGVLGGGGRLHGAPQRAGHPAHANLPAHALLPPHRAARLRRAGAAHPARRQVLRLGLLRRQVAPGEAPRRRLLCAPPNPPGVCSPGRGRCSVCATGVTMPCRCPLPPGTSRLAAGCRLRGRAAHRRLHCTVCV